MDRFLSESEAVEMLQSRVAHLPQVTVAGEMGISPQLLCDVLKGRRPIPAGALAYLGLEEVGRMFRVTASETKKVPAPERKRRQAATRPVAGESDSKRNESVGANPDQCPECFGLRGQHQKGCKRG